MPYPESLTCPDCHHYRDTPNHYFSCEPKTSNTIKKEHIMPTNLTTPKLTEGEKEALAFAKEVLLPKLGQRAAEIAVYHLIGRIVAPKLFKSYARTYVLAGILQGLLGSPKKLTDEEKARVESISAKLKAEKASRESGV